MRNQVQQDSIGCVPPAMDLLLKLRIPEDLMNICVATDEPIALLLTPPDGRLLSQLLEHGIRIVEKFLVGIYQRAHPFQGWAIGETSHSDSLCCFGNCRSVG